MTIRLPPGPLIPEPGMSDPHALVLGDTVYLFCGHDVGFGIPDWVMPEWRIYRSGDLCTWTQVGSIRPNDCYMGAGCTRCFAGDIVERHGRFWWYFSNGSKETGVMVAERPEGPWRDALGGPLAESFDPTVFVDVDDAPYLIVGYGDYRIARLQESMTALAEPMRPIALDRRGIFPVCDKNTLHHHAGTYYLGCSGYYATASSLAGPFVHRGLVGTGHDLETYYAHGDFFTWRGDTYHVWCRYRDRSVDRIRDCFLAPVRYDADGSLHDDLGHLDPL